MISNTQIKELKTKKIKKIVKISVSLHFCSPAAPSAPKDFKVLEVTRQHVHLTWEAPEHDGGSPLTGYQVEKRDMSRKTWVKVRHQNMHSIVRAQPTDDSLNFLFVFI